MTNAAREFLSFSVRGKAYAIDILSVREIRWWESATELPGLPAYVKGVIDLRGSTVPIVDLAERFSMKGINDSANEHTSTAVVIVLRGAGNQSDVNLGLLVDSVSDVYKVEEVDILPAPNMGGQLDVGFVAGMVNLDGTVIVLLNPKSLLDTETLYQSPIAKEQSKLA